MRPRSTTTGIALGPPAWYSYRLIDPAPLPPVATATRESSTPLTEGSRCSARTNCGAGPKSLPFRPISEISWKVWPNRPGCATVSDTP